MCTSFTSRCECLLSWALVDSVYVMIILAYKVSIFFLFLYADEDS